MNQQIIVVDDSLTIRKIFEVYLRREGYAVKSFVDARELFRWLETPQAHIPALMFVDVCLPEMDGYGIIQRLKARAAFAHTVFVMISRYNGVIDRLNARLARA